MLKAETRRRSLVSFTADEYIQLAGEAAKSGLRFATYIRSLVLTHQGRGRGPRGK